MDDIRELDKSLEKEKNELSEVLCDLSIIGNLFRTMWDIPVCAE